MAIIKQIEVNGATHDIDAKYWDGHTFDDSIKLKFVVVWSDLQYQSSTAPSATTLAGIPQVIVKYNNGANSATGTMIAGADTTDKSAVYMIYDPNLSSAGATDNYDEYMAVKKGNTGVDLQDYVWERIGGTGSIDLSNYVLKGTYITGGPSVLNTGETGDASCVTGSGGSGVGTVGGTLSLSGNSGEAGAHTLTIDLGSTNFSASGKIDIPGHTHGISSTTDTLGVLTQAPNNTGNESAHTHTVTTHKHPGNVTVITGLDTTTDTFTCITSVGTTPSITAYNYGFGITNASNVMYSPTVQAGVLKWSTANATTKIGFSAGSVPSITNKTVVTGTTHSGTASVAQAPIADTITTSGGSAHSHGLLGFTYATITYVKSVGANTEFGGAASSQTVSVALSGSQTFSFASHNHSVNLSTNSFSQVSVAIPGHTHSYSQIPKHKHTMTHTHNVDLSVPN